MLMLESPIGLEYNNVYNIVLHCFVCSALYLMTKRNFKSPSLQHKNKWSDNFHDFLRFGLQKEPKRRPTAMELLKVQPSSHSCGVYIIEVPYPLP